VTDTRDLPYFPSLPKYWSGTITVFLDPIENDYLPKPNRSALPRCDRPLFWAIAEPRLRGWVCHHCIEVN